jgi:Uma2 family endonuclease
MEAHRTGSRWTYAEFARLPGGDGKRREIIADELVVTPAPRRAHQRVVMDLGTILNTFVRAHELGELYPGPVDVLFAEGDYLEPDLVFVLRGRHEVLTDRGVEGPPDLVVEVTSPSTEERDRGFKLERYRLYGVPEYWVVDPEARTIDVWRFGEGTGEPLTLEADDFLRWAPMEGGPRLEVRVEEVLREV